jgi:Vacuolar sorting-associated protein 13, N-terminal
MGRNICVWVRLPQAPNIAKELAVEGLSLYWQVPSSSLAALPGGPGDTAMSPLPNLRKATSDPGLAATSASTAGRSRGTSRAAMGPVQDAILQPLRGVLSFTVHATARPLAEGGSGASFEAGAVVESLEVHLRKEQYSDMLRLMDAATIWVLRNKYAVFRPTGWRSDPTVSVPWRYVGFLHIDWHLECSISDWIAVCYRTIHHSLWARPTASCTSGCCAVLGVFLCSAADASFMLWCSQVWQYAIKAVLMDLQSKSGKRGPSFRAGQTEGAWQEKRSHYIQLYQRRLELLKQGGPGALAVQASAL